MLDRPMKLMYLGDVNRASHKTVREEICRRLSALLGLPPSQVKARPGGRTALGNALAGQMIAAGPHRFVVSFKAEGTTAPVTAAARAVCAFAERMGKNTIPLVATPYMGKAGSQVCADMGASWMDLSGNARIEAPGLRIHFVGHPN